MDFAAGAYAEGISNEAAGSEIEVLGDTIATTRSLLAELYRSTRDPDTREQITAVSESWADLLDALREHPENEELSFGNEDDNEDDIDFEHEIRTMPVGSIICFEEHPEYEIERKDDERWVVRYEGDKHAFYHATAIIEFIES